MLTLDGEMEARYRTKGGRLMPLIAPPPSVRRRLILLCSALLFPTGAWAACPSGYNNGCDAGTGIDVCTQTSNYEVSCDLGAHAGSGNTEAWAVSPSSTSVRIWGLDESSAGWCCEYTVASGCQVSVSITGTPQTDTVDFNYLALHLVAGGWAYGGAGSDTLSASNDATCTSHLYGDAGTDTLQGFAGNDDIHGGDDADTISGGAGADNLYGDAGGNTIFGNDGADYIEAGTDNDGNYVKGGDGADIIVGGPGNDTLCGGDGDDDIEGWAPAAYRDVLYGGLGQDNLHGKGTSIDTRCENSTYDAGDRDGCDSVALSSGCGW